MTYRSPRVRRLEMLPPPFTEVGAMLRRVLIERAKRDAFATDKGGIHWRFHTHQIKLMQGALVAYRRIMQEDAARVREIRRNRP